MTQREPSQFLIRSVTQIAAIKKFSQAQLQLSVKPAANMDTDNGGKTTAETAGVLLSVC